MAEKQIRSKKRVADHGEVFTAEREVKAMCDLVKQETERIESRFLEPACGNGNFLVEVLRRNLAVVENRYKKSAYDYERYSVLAVTSLYGVDILEDNAEECRKRLFDIWNKLYITNVKEQVSTQCQEAVKFILKKNIICGNALTMLKSDDTPIVFSEWSLVSGSQIKRRDFELNGLLNNLNNGPSLFLDNLEYDSELQEYIPLPIKEYPLTDYRRIQKYE